MITISAADLRQDSEHYQDIALLEPVAVTRDGREACVLVSAKEYARLKRRDRVVLATADATDDVVAAVAASEMDERHRHLDALIDDWTP